ncbi:unnamed protein product [Chrysoparadoxa australica]
MGKSVMGWQGASHAASAKPTLSSPMRWLLLLLLAFAHRTCAFMSMSASPRGLPAGMTRDITWSNPQGLDLTPICPNVWGAERPFYFLSLDVGGRMAVIKLGDGSLWIHSPVDLDDDLRKALAEIGPVKHIVSPNYEHLKWAPQWIEAFPDAESYGCPGVLEKKPDVKWKHSIGDSTPACWPEEIEPLWLDCETVPFSDKPFFNEVLFFHKPTKSLLVTDAYWNYPRSMTRLRDRFWKWAMDVIYLNPVYRGLMVDKQKMAKCLEAVNGWDVERIIPCHGHIVNAKAKEAFLRQVRDGVLTTPSMMAESFISQ